MLDSFHLQWGKFNSEPLCMVFPIQVGSELVSTYCTRSVWVSEYDRVIQVPTVRLNCGAGDVNVGALHEEPAGMHVPIDMIMLWRLRP